MRKLLFGGALALVLVLGACSSTSGTAQPLTAAQVQQDLANAVYLMQAAGCAVQNAAATAAPIISVSADSQGNQVLTAVNAAGAVACKLTVPPTALPVPATAGAPAATVTARPTPAAS